MLSEQAEVAVKRSSVPVEATSTSVSPKSKIKAQRSDASHNTEQFQEECISEEYYLHYQQMILRRQAEQTRTEDR